MDPVPTTPLSCGGTLLAAVLPFAAAVVLFGVTHQWWLVLLGIAAFPVLCATLALWGGPARLRRIAPPAPRPDTTAARRVERAPAVVAAVRAELGEVTLRSSWTGARTLPSGYATAEAPEPGHSPATG